MGCIETAFVISILLGDVLLDDKTQRIFWLGLHPFFNHSLVFDEPFHIFFIFQYANDQK